MFQEFFFTPEAFRNATKNGIYRALVCLAAMAFTILVLYASGLQAWHITAVNMLVAWFFLFTAFMEIAGAQKRVRDSRIYITPEGLHFKSKTSEMKIPFSQLQKIELLPSGALLIYSGELKAIPALTVSNLGNREAFLELLRPYAPLTETNKMPLIIHPWFKAAFTFFYMTGLAITLLSTHLPLLLFAGLFFLALVIYQLISILRLRKVYSSPVSVASTIIFLILIPLRLGFAFFTYYIHR